MTWKKNLTAHTDLQARTLLMNIYEKLKKEQTFVINIKQNLNVSQFSVAKSETLTLIISGQNTNVYVSTSIKIHARPKKKI